MRSRTLVESLREALDCPAMIMKHSPEILGRGLVVAQELGKRGPGVETPDALLCVAWIGQREIDPHRQDDNHIGVPSERHWKALSQFHHLPALS
jgi:hypothetical protein